jgi:hypothetical protein
MEQGKDFYENNTRIVFDYNLKLLVQQLHREHPHIIEKLKSYDYDMLQEAQLFIREYFLVNQKEINIAGRLTKKPESCPDYFALLCAVVSDLTKCENWREVWQQYVTGVYKYAQYPVVFDIEEKVLCMCSHLCKAENMAIIPNQYTNLNLYIACDCIAKTGIINSYEFKKKAKMNDRYAEIMVKREYLKKVKKSLEQKWSNIVNLYTEKIKTHKRCLDCTELKIEKGSFKTRCYICYENYQIKNNKKPPKGVCFLKMKK